MFPTEESLIFYESVYPTQISLFQIQFFYSRCRASFLSAASLVCWFFYQLPFSHFFLMNKCFFFFYRTEINIYYTLFCSLGCVRIVCNFYTSSNIFELFNADNKLYCRNKYHFFPISVALFSLFTLTIQNVVQMTQQLFYRLLYFHFSIHIESRCRVSYF